jgi:hypothetical protein
MRRDERQDGVVDGHVPTERLEGVFGLVANELRIEILLELWEQYPEPITFADLHSEIGIRDSGRFNYHLNVLRPEFVHKTDDGYRPTHAGREVIGAAVSGSFTDGNTLDIGPVPAGECMFCSGDLTARYDEGQVVVTCTDCDDLIAKLPISPVAVSTVDPERMPEVFSNHLLTMTHELSVGFCKRCHGHVDARLTALSDDESATYRDALDVRFVCRQCRDRTNLNVGAVVMNHPAVTSFLFDAGVDLRETYVWEVLPLLDPEETLVDGEEPRLHLRVELDGDALELTLDDSVTVVDYERV